MLGQGDGGAKERGRHELPLPHPRLSSLPLDTSWLLPEVRTLAGRMVARGRQGVENVSSPEGLRTSQGGQGVSLRRRGEEEVPASRLGRKARGGAAHQSPSCLLPPIYAQSSGPSWAHLASPSCVSTGSSFRGKHCPVGPYTVLSRCLRGGNKPDAAFEEAPGNCSRP